MSADNKPKHSHRYLNPPKLIEIARSCNLEAKS